MGYSTCTPWFFQGLQQGDPLFGVDKVHHAATKQGHPVTGMVHLLIKFGPQVPEGGPGNDRQAPEFMLLAEEERQVPDEPIPPGQGPLGQGGPAQDEMEEFAVLQNPAQQPIFQG